MEKIKNYINGKWVDSKSGKTFQSINPANKDEVIGIISKSGREDVDEAVKAAQEAYDGWRLMPAPRRGEFLFRAAEILSKNKETLGNHDRPQGMLPDAGTNMPRPGHPFRLW